MSTNNIVISGMRPSGRIHLGNYNGVIKNWINLQNQYDCFFFIADIHALTTNFNYIYNLNKRSKKILIEWVASGINYKKSTIFIQSHIPEIFELNILLSMITNIARLERIPSYKMEKQNNNIYGFLGYPILQASDILILNAKYVPVGEDQIPHIEFVKEIVKKINNNFLNNSTFKFNEPVALLHDHSKVFGNDGSKMSKSKNNSILISNSGKILKKKINQYITDSNKIYKNQPGIPENCYVWSLHKIYTFNNEKIYIKKSCLLGNIGCVDCKNILFNNIEKENIKLIKNIKFYEKKEKYINDLIIANTKKVRSIAKIILKKFKHNLNLL